MWVEKELFSIQNSKEHSRHELYGVYIVPQSLGLGKFFFSVRFWHNKKRQLTENFKLHKLDVGAHTFPEGSAFGAVNLVQCSQWIRDPV